jgi:hypothetical protein
LNLLVQSINSFGPGTRCPANDDRSRSAISFHPRTSPLPSLSINTQVHSDVGAVVPAEYLDLDNRRAGSPHTETNLRTGRRQQQKGRPFPKVCDFRDENVIGIFMCLTACHDDRDNIPKDAIRLYEFFHAGLVKSELACSGVVPSSECDRQFAALQAERTPTFVSFEQKKK